MKLLYIRSPLIGTNGARVMPWIPKQVSNETISTPTVMAWCVYCCSTWSIECSRWRCGAYCRENEPFVWCLCMDRIENGSLSPYRKRTDLKRRHTFCITPAFHRSRTKLIEKMENDSEIILLYKSSDVRFRTNLFHTSHDVRSAGIFLKFFNRDTHTFGAVQREREKNKTIVSCESIHDIRRRHVSIYRRMWAAIIFFRRKQFNSLKIPSLRIWVIEKNKAPFGGPTLCVVIFTIILFRN